MPAKSAEVRDIWFAATLDFLGGESLESATFCKKGGSLLIVYCSAVMIDLKISFSLAPLEVPLWSPT